jgi:hypothetical protein
MPKARPSKRWRGRAVALRALNVADWSIQRLLDTYYVYELERLGTTPAELREALGWIRWARGRLGDGEALP